MRSLAFIVAALVLSVPIATAEDHHEDAAEDAAEGENESTEWEYELSVSDDTATVEIFREAGESEQSIEFEYNRDDAYVEFSLESETGEIEHESSMEVQFHQLLEYEDQNDNRRYDEGETIVQAFDLAQDTEDTLADGQGVTWTSIRQEPVTSANGVGGTKFTSSAGVGSGTLRFDFYVFADEATLGPVAIEATEIKLDIVISNFPYQSESSAVALFLETESEIEIENDQDVESDEDGVIAETDAAQLLFAWNDFADVDGQETSVETTRLNSESSQEDGEYENEELFVFSYARGRQIVHDPTMGVSPGGSSNGIPAPGVSLMLAGLVIAAVGLRRR